MQKRSPADIYEPFNDAWSELKNDLRIRKQKVRWNISTTNI